MEIGTVFRGGSVSHRCLTNMAPVWPEFGNRDVLEFPGIRFSFNTRSKSILKKAEFYVTPKLLQMFLWYSFPVNTPPFSEYITKSR